MPSSAEEKFEFDTWDDFKSRFQTNLVDPTTRNDSTFVFRGQGGDDWPLEPSFSRTFRLADPTLTSDLQKRLLSLFENEMRIAEGSHDRAKWPLGQHQGLPTPLLDWSLSPYVAAFFASESALRYMLANMSPGDMPPDRRFGIVALRKTGHGVDKIWNAMQVEFEADWPLENQRIRFQRGLFTLVPPMFRTLNECIKFYTANHSVSTWLLKTFAIPYSEVVPALRDLESMDINFRRLYGGIDGICKSATLQAQLDYFEDHVLR